MGTACFLLGFILQWALFEAGLWRWDVRKDQDVLRVRIDRLEGVDLESMLHELKEYGMEIERALLVLGYSREEEVKK